MNLTQLLKDIRSCTICASDLPCGPRPIIQAHTAAQLRIIGQAPGQKVHTSGIPWDDASGKKLREWLALTSEQFYDPAIVALMPMGFCYPGKGKTGYLPPRIECAPKWHAPLDSLLPNIGLTLLIGQYAQAQYLPEARALSLTETVRNWKTYAPQQMIPLPHPSPRNRHWFVNNPWFERDLLPDLQHQITALRLARAR